MSRVISIDPGKSKCGLTIVDMEEKKVYEALVIRSSLLLNYVKKECKKDKRTKILIGNGTGSKHFVKPLNKIASDVIIAAEKNSTYRAKERYFDIFPLKGIKSILPREIFIINKNLDALAALIILEDFYRIKFDVTEMTGTKTWLKS